MKERKLTVVGLVDPIELVTRLRKLWHADILSVGPAKDGKAAAEDQRDGGVMEPCVWLKGRVQPGWVEPLFLMFGWRLEGVGSDPEGIFGSDPGPTRPPKSSGRVQPRFLRLGSVTGGRLGDGHGDGEGDGRRRPGRLGDGEGDGRRRPGPRRAGGPRRQAEEAGRPRRRRAE